MKKYLVLLPCFLAFSITQAQNVGINTSTPEAALDVYGDIIFRTVNLVVNDGITLDVDVNTTRSAYYRISGPTVDFTIAGITAGIDGRLISLFNHSGFTMQLNNEDGIAPATNQIVTGTNANLLILHKGIVTFQYDGTEGKWIVKSSSAGGGVSGGFWEANGNDIYTTNSGNVGIGTNIPVTKLTMLTPYNTMGWTHIGINGPDSIIVNQGIGGVSASMGTKTNHTFRLNTFNIGRLHIYPTGEVVIGTNNTGSFGKLTVETPNNSYGISHTSDQGNILSTRIGGSSAGIGTFSNTNMRIFCNGVSAMIFAAATGNVGIGTEDPTYKLTVNGTIRTKEVIVETGWADYVFDKNYKLRPLKEVEIFIEQNKHLPGIPTAAEIEKNGLQLGNTQAKMMEKIEELTLYIIEMNKRIALLEKTRDK